MKKMIQEMMVKCNQKSGESWPIYPEGMEESYILEPLVIQELSHSVKLGISFLTKHKLKLICIEEELDSCL